MSLEMPLQRAHPKATVSRVVKKKTFFFSFRVFFQEKKVFFVFFP